MSERMTDAEWLAELSRREHESPHKAMWFAAREADRARASEDAKDATIQALADALLAQLRKDRRGELNEHGLLVSSERWESHTAACWEKLHAVVTTRAHGDDDCAAIHAALKAAGRPI